MASKHDQSMMDNLYWWGVPTLFRAPQAEPEGADIALVGVPHSTGNGTTERDQHLGPRAVRNVSALQRRAHGGFQLDPWEAVHIVDAGDVPFPRANDNEDCIARITDFYRDIDASGARPVRDGVILRHGDKTVGSVTSGGFAPSLDRPAALGFVDAEFAVAGTSLLADTRGKPTAITVSALPFVQHQYFR